MKYVEIDPVTGEVSWDRYFEYIGQSKEFFPPELFKYVASWENYSLDGSNTLHDAWLEDIAFGNTTGDLSIGSIKLKFLGPFHDRYHEFSYSGVRSFCIELQSSTESGYRDLIAHEFRIEEKLFVHEMRFANNGVVSVTFEEASISQKALSSC